MEDAPARRTPEGPIRTCSGDGESGGGAVLFAVLLADVRALPSALWEVKVSELR